MGLLQTAINAGRAPFGFLRGPTPMADLPTRELHLVESRPPAEHPDWIETWAVGHVAKDVYFGHVGKSAVGGWQYDTGCGWRGRGRARDRADAIGRLILAADTF